MLKRFTATMLCLIFAGMVFAVPAAAAENPAIKDEIIMAAPLAVILSLGGLSGYAA
ncbi:MAG: hypothetical protein LBE55_03625 [Clostridiales bacterium]|jgi:hypothetical protein|nr:hypothetical protein [Clostridiales bacterium]